MTPLEREIAALIESEGPIRIDRYMALALGHPVYGYYTTRDPFGAAGDFTTAPEISQIFGELIGLWAAETWCLLGEPDAVRLVELGPGRGTLMADAVRAAGVVPAFAAALDIHLVETSPRLRALQRAALPSRTVTWHDTIATVPPGPAIVIANEFFDALPIRQFVWTARGWCERVVGRQADRFVVGLAPAPDALIQGSAAPDTVVEINAAAQTIMQDLAERVATQGGAVLAIDYGGTGFGDTLQAVARHRFVDPWATPGEADLTAHVDFAALRRAAERGGARPHGPIAQGVLLQRLGLEARAARLAAAAPDRADAVWAGAKRLIADQDEAGAGRGMGSLFRVLAVTPPALATVPGFEDTA